MTAALTRSVRRLLTIPWAWTFVIAMAGTAPAITLTPTSTRTRTPTPTATSTPMPTATPTSSLLADVNCDRVSSAPDLTAAIIVSVEPEQFPACRGADLFRGRPLTNSDFLVIYPDLFAELDAPWTPTPTASATATPTGARTTSIITPTATTSPTRTPTPSPTHTATATPTRTPTAPPPLTRTVTPMRTATRTRTPSQTPVPTGVAFQLSGDWVATWGGQICYILGQPFDRLQNVTYRITAVDGRLDIEIFAGVRIGRGLEIERNGSTYSVRTRYRVFSGNVCPLTGVPLEYVFDYTFTLRLDGRGTGAATWSYGENTNCASCRVTDAATLVRVAGPR